jgi:hypothetical protein
LKKIGALLHALFLKRAVAFLELRDALPLSSARGLAKTIGAKTRIEMI